MFGLQLSGTAQKKPLAELPSDVDYKNGNAGVFFIKDTVLGSAYLSRNWMSGSVELASHVRLPEPGGLMLCNFNKMKSVLYILTDTNKILVYPIDSVLSFTVTGNNKTYEFEKVQWVSNSFYLMPVFSSVKGYSLYKRLYTKIVPADYTNGGYFTSGNKFDSYLDAYEYYLLYPGSKDYTKITLKESVIRRALKQEAALVKEYFSIHEEEFNEQSILGLIQYIDDKKFPE